MCLKTIFDDLNVIKARIPRFYYCQYPLFGQLQGGEG